MKTPDELTGHRHKFELLTNDLPVFPYKTTYALCSCGERVDNPAEELTRLMRFKLQVEEITIQKRANE